MAAGRKRDHRETGRLLPERVARFAERIPGTRSADTAGIKLCFSDGVTNGRRTGVMREGGFLSSAPGSNSRPCGAVRGRRPAERAFMLAPFEALVDQFDAPRSEAAVHGGAAARQGAGVADGRSTFVNTRNRITRIARTTYDRLCADLGCDYRLRDIADSFGISVDQPPTTTFREYGVPVPNAYLRERRLPGGREAALRSPTKASPPSPRTGGLREPLSKFSAAFKRRYNSTPASIGRNDAEEERRSAPAPPHLRRPVNSATSASGAGRAGVNYRSARAAGRTRAAPGVIRNVQCTPRSSSVESDTSYVVQFAPPLSSENCTDTICCSPRRTR